jgi:hypothetical protein
MSNEYGFSSALQAHDHFQKVEAEKAKEAAALKLREAADRKATEAAVIKATEAATLKLREALKPKEPDAPKVKEYVVQRDGLRPFSFSGVMLAQSSTQNLAQDTVTAAVYRTSGGKFISTFTRKNTMDFSRLTDLANIGREADPDDDKPAPVDRSKTNKAEVFETIEDAAGWFKPGRLTDSLRKQLGLDEPIRIE